MILRLKKVLTNRGFSLVELMIVVAIIGVLATLAVPKFQLFQAKARQGEVKTSLSHIYTLEVAYHGDYDTYTTFASTGFQVGTGQFASVPATHCPGNAIGFSPSPCIKARYSYEGNSASDVAFTGQGTTGTDAGNKVFVNCATADTWSIDQDKILTNTGNPRAIETCN